MQSSNNSYYSHFGYTIDISDDKIIVGAAATSNGAVYLYEKPDTGWTDTNDAMLITASDGVSQDFFGYSVSIDNNTMLIGAINSDDIALDNGAAYFMSYEVGTRINSPKDNSFMTYPNPAHDIIYFKDNSTFPEKAEIFDMSGRLMKIVNTGSDNSINISMLKPGIYFLQLNTSEGKYVIKFIKK